jgi:hypothetical protein
MKLKIHIKISPDVYSGERSDFYILVIFDQFISLKNN